MKKQAGETGEHRVSNQNWEMKPPTVETDGQMVSRAVWEVLKSAFEEGSTYAKTIPQLQVDVNAT